MQRKVIVELSKKRNAFTNQNRQDRITHFVSEAELKTFGADAASANEPDASIGGSQAVVDELREIPGVELDCFTRSRQVASRQNESGFVSVSPSKSLRFKPKRGLVSSRSHYVAIDGFQKCRDEIGVHRFAAFECVRGFEPVDATVLARDESVEACCHVDRYA